MNTPVYAKMAKLIDLHRFVVFSCINNILRRVYVYPFISSNPSSFYCLFNRSMSKKQVNENTNDIVGLSMDSISFAFDEDSKNKMDNAKAAAKPYYKEIYSCLNHSLFHSNDKKNGMSRHSSLLSLKDYNTTNTCLCNPDKEAVRKRVQKHECLESIAIHLNCCIPSIMRCLQQFDDILFLKIYICLFLFIP